MSTLLEREGRYASCVKVLEEGLASATSARALQVDLAKMLSAAPVDALRDGTRAVTLAESVCFGEDVTAKELDVLAAGYAETRQFASAVATATQAHTLALNQARAAEERHDPGAHRRWLLLARSIEQRRDLYRTRRPFRISRPAPR